MIERITHIEQEDALRVIELGKQFYSLAGLNGEFHGDTFIDFWNKFLNTGHAAMWACRENGQIVGAIGVILSLSFFDGKVIAEEQFWFVDAESRGTAGIRLFMEMKKWAKDSGAQRIIMGRMSEIDSEVGKFYERQGFKTLQIQYALDL